MAELFGVIAERGCRYTGVPQEPKERLTRWAMGNLDRKTRERKNQEKKKKEKSSHFPDPSKARTIMVLEIVLDGM